MLDTLRTNIAKLIYPGQQKAAAEKVVGFQITPGQPIYTNMSIEKATRDGYACSVYVYRGVRTIIQAASAIPWVALDRDGERIPGHEFEKLMANPNPYFSGQDLIEFTIAHLCLGGNSLWQPMMVNGKPREFWLTMPDKVKPIPGGDWISGWEVKGEGGKSYTSPPETFLHFMQANPGNPYWGIGPLQAAARTVDTDNEAQDTQKVTMQNRAMPSGVLIPDVTIPADKFEQVKEQFKDMYKGNSERRAPWLLNAGMKWQQMSLSAVEMDFIASRLQNKRDIAAAFGISPIFLGDLEQSSYNNMAEARKALYQDVVIPMLDDIQATLNMRIAPLYGDITIGYDLSGVAALRADFTAKVTQAQILWGMGVPFEQINNRLEMGFEKFEGWNRSYMPFSLMPVGKSMQLPVGRKSAGMSEEQKTAAWKRIDSRRIGWWGVVGDKMQELYESNGEILAGIKGKTPEQCINSASNALKDAEPEWEEKLSAVYMSLIEDFGTDVADDLGMRKKADEVFDPFTEAAIAWIKKNAAKTVTTIMETELEAVREIIQAGFGDGLSIQNISKQIRQYYDDNSAWKAARVARTEVAKAAGYGQQEAARQSGVVQTHTWLAARDDRTRDSHAFMDGETVPLGKPYSNGLMYPGDSSGSADEVINCRCTELFGVD
ncbi:MAG: phage portal protein [Candidatus Doudnabacteria bacterium]|jgi:HK97 family phage portal protein